MDLRLNIAAPLKRSFGRVLDAVLPPRCLKCGEVVAAPGALCPSCWQQLSFLEPPCCACCGQPFDFDLGPDALCGACTASPPAFDRARSVLRYDETSRDLILAFKHADRTSLAPTFGAWLHRVGRDLLADSDLIVPVPLHWSRLFARRYNQAALLAQSLGTVSGKPVLPDLLMRRRATQKQGHLGRLARQRNVAGAFVLHPGRAKALAGRRILLIDDVITTGATISNCAKILRKGGAEKVNVLAVARVIQED
ncbi:MAG: ComF family protein [Proteobacteria bacterium]|nr:ComF family protein [Pseudomonadota bacterium]